MRPERWRPWGTLGQAPAAFELAADAPAGIDPGLVQVARELALVAPAEERRAVFLLAAAVLALGGEGSTRLPLDAGSLHARLQALGAADDDLPAVDRFLETARRGEAALAGPAGSSAPLIVVEGHLTSGRLLARERDLGDRWRALLAAEDASPEAADRALADVVARPPRGPDGRPAVLTEEQRAAVRLALGRRLAAITGGPGTGKTSLVVALLRAWVRMRPPGAGGAAAEIALAAPTGRAADRLGGAVARAIAAIADPAPADAALAAMPPVATTLHRLLSWSPGGERFRRHERNPLPHGLVVVDESSMIDLDLALRLARARGDATLVLLGDAEQLPPVEEGAPFRDLVAAGRGVARLTRSFRMDAADPAGRRVLALAAAVRRGNVPGPEVLARRERVAELTLGEPELLVARGVREAFLARWLEARVLGVPEWKDSVLRVWRSEELSAAPDALTALFDVHERSRLLVAVRGRSGGAGLAAVDAWVRAHLAPRLGVDPRIPWPPGQPVMVTRNDYERGLFNGDQGVVLRVADQAGDEERAVFRRGDRFVAFPLPALDGALEASWATTVHKAQGGEHDHVALLLPDRPVRTLTRELIYTAITRARRSVTLVGDEERLASPIGSPGERRTGLAAALAEVSGAVSAPVPQVPPTDEPDDGERGDDEGGGRQLTLF